MFSQWVAGHSAVAMVLHICDICTWRADILTQVGFIVLSIAGVGNAFADTSVRPQRLDKLLKLQTVHVGLALRLWPTPAPVLTKTVFALRRIR